MVLARCPFCTHSNPSGARFCNECGSPLHLRPCEHCEAVNDVLSRECHRCGAPLRIERQREPVHEPALAHVGGATPQWDTTVAVAYGEAPGASTRYFATWRHAGDAVESDFDSSPPRDVAGELDAAAGARREPFAEAVAPDDDTDWRAARGAPGSARRLVTILAGMAIAGLAALGGYMFIQRAGVPIETPVSQPAAPAPATSETPTTSEMPPAREPAAADATPPRDASSPQAATPSSQDAPPTNADSANEAPASADAVPAAARGAATGGAAAQPPKTERKSAPPPKASQDAIETQRIITRELGGFGPPPTR